MKRAITFLLVFFVGILFSQQSSAQKDLLKKTNENFHLLKKNPEKAFRNAQEIEKVAIKINAEEAELSALSTECGYYKTKSDFEKLLTTTKSLSQKAELYGLPTYQAIAKKYLFEAYIFSGLPDKALTELQNGLEMINKVPEDSLAIMTKANLLIAYSNYYLNKKDYKNQLKYLKLSGKEARKLADGNHKKRWLYVYYANISMAYQYIDLDSAKYYAELSLANKNKNFENYNEAEALSLSVLGEVAMKKGNYEKAISYFKNSEKLSGYKNHLNIETLYDNIINVYQKLGKKDSVQFYQSKKDSLNLTISKNQNKSLHQLLDEKDHNAYKNYIYVFVFIVFLMAVILFFVLRKNRILARQEKNSQHYLERNSEKSHGEDYTKLLEMLKNNDPAFMVYFNEVYPGFSSKLEKINPKMTPAETEFCTLLKLKIPTKEISKYKYIELQTVRNKKYLIRKKLQIPPDMDIYKWFDNL